LERTSGPKAKAEAGRLSSKRQEGNRTHNGVSWTVVKRIAALKEESMAKRNQLKANRAKSIAEKKKRRKKHTAVAEKKA